MARNKKEPTSQPSDSNILEKKIAELELQIVKLETIIKENEWDESRDITDIEAICIQQIRRLRDKSVHAVFCEADAKILDLLHKNLKMARGQVTLSDNSKKAKKLSKEELFKIVGVD